MEEEKKKRGRPRKEEWLRRPLATIDKMALEWAALWCTQQNASMTQEQMWDRVYDAVRRRYGDVIAKDSSLHENAVRYANRPEVKDYYKKCCDEVLFREQALREKIEQEVFSSDRRIKEFIEKRGVLLKPEKREDNGEMTVDSTVRELIELKDRIDDPKDRAAILMKIADFGGVKTAGKEERRKVVYMPLVCKDCTLYALGERALRERLSEAADDIPEGRMTPQQEQSTAVVSSEDDNQAVVRKSVRRDALFKGTTAPASQKDIKDMFSRMDKKRRQSSS